MNAMIRESEAQIHHFGMEVEALAELRFAVSEGTELPATLPSGRRAETTFFTGQFPDGHKDESMCLRITDANGHEICSLQRTTEELSQEYLVQWLEQELVWRRAALYDRLASRVSANPQESLRFIDFVYFSGVTQTTVGYGDILPNTSGIRTLVLFQILWGYALLIIVLNLVIMNQ
jgi:hypothetical protein